MINKTLVLGASGNIGTFLVKELKNKNAGFVAGVPAHELDKLRHLNIDQTALDFGEPSSLDRAMKGINTLFMLLPLEEPITRWAKNIIDAARSNNISFILRSSIIDAHPESPYSLFSVHGRIDQMVRDSGIPFAIVHPNSFMQNFVVYYAEAINRNDCFSFTQGNEKISYNDVRDIAAVNAQILADPLAHVNREYTVTGPGALSHHEIAGILSRAAGRSIRYARISEQEYREGLSTMGLSLWDIEMLMSIEHHVRDGKQDRISNDVHLLTGRAPISFEHFARDYADSWKKVPVEA